MQFITTGNRIAVENFEIGYFYTINMLSGNYFQACCTGIGSDFVMFSRDEPDLLFSLTMQSAADVSSIELYGGGSGTSDYNDLSNKPQINSITLIGNKSLSDLGIQETISDLDTIRSGAASGATAVQPAAMSAALAAKQDTLSSAQLSAVNSGIDSTKVAQIEINKNNILLFANHYKYDDRQLYLQEAIATENIAVDSTWIDRKTISSYTASTNIVGGEIEQGAWLTPSFGKSDANNRCRLSNSMAVIAGNTYTVTLNNPIINNARILIHYRGADKKTLSETGWQSTIPYTFMPPSNCKYITIVFSNSANTNCTPSDFGDLQINKGSTAQTYASPAWS